MTEPVAVAGLHQGPGGLHGVQKVCAAGSLAAVVGYQQHIGFQAPGGLRHQPRLLGRFDIARQQSLRAECDHNARSKALEVLQLLGVIPARLRDDGRRLDFVDHHHSGQRKKQG